MNKTEFENIKAKAEKYMYSSFRYVEYDDISAYTIEKNNTNIILIQGINRETEIREYIWAVNEVDILIKSMQCENSFYLSFIPLEWITTLKAAGFIIRNAWHDYFINNLDSIEIKTSKEFDYLKLTEIEIVAEITKKCRNQSRGFTGQTTDWMKEWLYNEEIENTAILAHRLRHNEIAGILCVGLYRYSNESGPTVWIKEVAVMPQHQNKGIGRKLINQGLLYGKQRGAKRAFLAADEENVNAIHLYTSLGFLPSEEHSEITMIKV